MKKMIYYLLNATLVILLLSMANPVLAQPKHVFDVDIAGTATLVSYGGHDQIYKYEYTLTFAKNNTKDISHWSLELSACIEDEDLIDPGYTDGSWTITKPCFNEPILGDQICGIKFDAGVIIIREHTHFISTVLESQ